MGSNPVAICSIIPIKVVINISLFGSFPNAEYAYCWFILPLAGPEIVGFSGLPSTSTPRRTNAGSPYRLNAVSYTHLRAHET